MISIAMILVLRKDLDESSFRLIGNILSISNGNQCFYQVRIVSSIRLLETRPKQYDLDGIFKSVFAMTA